MGASVTQSRLSELAQTIASKTAIVEKYYLDHGLAMPSFGVEGPVDVRVDDADVERARVAVIEASIELKDLLEGPIQHIRPYLNGGASLQAIYKFDLPSKVPLDGEISYDELARLCGQRTDIVRRLVRFAIAHHRVFREGREGFVSHCAASKFLAEDDDAMAGLGVMFDECYQAFAHTVEALEKNPNQSPFHCGWTVAHRTNDPVWVYNAKHPERGQRMSKAMRSFAKGFGHDVVSLLRGYDWASLDSRNKDALIVDIGGANGHASILLAQQYPNLRFQVQDLPDGIETGRQQIPLELQERITFEAHDFKQPQQTQADVFLLRQILHDWPDVDCIKILRALIPALRPGVRVVMNDFVVPPPGVISPLFERHIRSMDVIVMSYFGSREREEKDWKKLFNEADPRFVNIKTSQPDGFTMAVIEATWRG